MYVNQIDDLFDNVLNNKRESLRKTKFGYKFC